MIIVKIFRMIMVICLVITVSYMCFLVYNEANADPAFLENIDITTVIWVVSASLAVVFIYWAIFKVVPRLLPSGGSYWDLTEEEQEECLRAEKEREYYDALSQMGELD